MNDLQWREIRVRGIVQGVGFRPAIWRQAMSLDLLGGVRNTLGGVLIVIGGPTGSVDTFEKTLKQIAPVGSRIDAVDIRESPALETSCFSIWPSESNDRADSVIPPDLATCEECLGDISDSHNRRFQYPFTTCTHCGPRYSVVESLPYDRQRTTMEEFPLCGDCRDEYESPLDRRYHAESTSCPACGPQLLLYQPYCEPIVGNQALERAIDLIAQGAVGAIKGIGGFHLCCDPKQAEGITRLRQRKQRPHRPLAVMATSVETIRRLAEVSATEEEWLKSPARPIVLLRKCCEVEVDIERMLEDLSPNNARVGVMLPYSPLHSLLLAHFDLLVMTSANEREEPISGTDEEVLPSLGEVDFILTHTRRIWNKCDDSVMLVHHHEGSEDRAVMLRRARGFVPLPLQLPHPSAQEILCCGGDLKNVFALVRGANAYLSAHLGDLENAAAFENFAMQIERMQDMFRIKPSLIVHDLHPAYHSTQYALRSTIQRKLGVQHHHAHLAACLAENQHEGRALGIIFDGTGYGTDGTIWGGEFLLGDVAQCERVGRFAPLTMPGGEQSIRDPWKMALGALLPILGRTEAVECVAKRAPELRQSVALLTLAMPMVDFPRTSSVGRLFDIMAFLLGAGAVSTFEAQHPLYLENLALAAKSAPAMPRFVVTDEAGFLQIDLAEFWQATVERIANGEERAGLALAFHYALAEAAASVAEEIGQRHGVDTVALSGGVFANELLSVLLERRLKESGFRVLQHRYLPPGDGCLAYGQAAVACAVV